MKIIKKGTPEEIVSVIRELQGKIQNLEETVRASKIDYSELLEVLKPALLDLVEARDGQRVAREKQLDQVNGLFLLEVTGALKGMRKVYGGKSDSEMARILELVAGYNKENYRKLLGQKQIEVSALDRDSAHNSKQQLVELLRANGCSYTADLIANS
tara:strand:- start:2142 stop:2612 length:471 start_codon:yes stop_codon:yes gene_type:complete